MSNKRKNYKSEPFKGFYGIQEVALPEEFPKSLQNRFEKAKRIGFSALDDYLPKRLDGKYAYVKILDSFFSDTFPQNLLVEIVSLSSEFGYKIQILLLNPFSEIAYMRSRSLKKNDNIIRLNKGLSKIIAALNNKREVVEPVGLNKPETIIEQLAKIEASKKNINLEIQFTSEFTELPVYIISQYAFKGHVLVGSSAVDNPWIICVDDYEQPEDLYDTYYNNFNKLWDNSQKELKISTEITKNSKVLIEKANGLNLEDFPNNDALKIHLKNLVGKNEIKETFDYLFKYYYLRGNERQNYNNLVILSSRFETVVTEYRVGILDFESYKTEIANLQAGVLLMIDAIK